LVGQRTGIVNQIRSFLLERGIAVRQGLRFLRAELPGILATRSDVLSPRMLHLDAFLDADRLELIDHHAVERGEGAEVVRERQLRAGACGSDKCHCEARAASGGRSRRHLIHFIHSHVERSA
jgi:hypothetical protein